MTCLDPAKAGLGIKRLLILCFVVATAVNAAVVRTAVAAKTARDELESERLVDTLVVVTLEALQPASVRLWLRGRQGDK